MHKKSDIFLFFSLLFFSGNPLSDFLFGKYSAFILLLISLTFIPLSTVTKFLNRYSSIFFLIVMLFTFQWLFLEFISILGAFNFLIKIIAGGIIIYHLKSKFETIFFDIIYKLSIISLLFYFFVNLFKFNFPSVLLQDNVHYYFIHVISFSHRLRNQGMFWEPGAYAGILTLCLAIRFHSISVFTRKDWRKTFTIIITLLTTQSSTGYLVFFIILLFFLFQRRNRVIVFLLLPVGLILISQFYQNTSFLSDKISDQYSESRDQRIGEFSNSRFGSFVFDWHYIKKHPLIGNGFSEKTRYSDHKYLFSYSKDNVNVIGSGNGFSNYLASLGILFVGGYFFFLYKSFLNIPKNKIFVWLIFLVVLLNMQGEQWLNFPLYLGLPFVVGNDSKNKLSW
jgi:hypothetical protein